MYSKYNEYMYLGNILTAGLTERDGIGSVHNRINQAGHMYVKGNVHINTSGVSEVSRKGVLAGCMTR